MPVRRLGPPVQNPGGVAGAGITFGYLDRSLTVADIVMVFNDAAGATEQAKSDGPNYPKYVTTAPQPFAVGNNGLIAVGMSPDNSKAVTYVTYAEGKVNVDLEFDSAPNEPTSQDVALDIAKKQDAIIKDKLPG